jgi:predicted hydrolase (HD superfamily)
MEMKEPMPEKDLSAAREQVEAATSALARALAEDEELVRAAGDSDVVRRT